MNGSKSNTYAYGAVKSVEEKMIVNLQVITDAILKRKYARVNDQWIHICNNISGSCSMNNIF